MFTLPDLEYKITQIKLRVKLNKQRYNLFAGWIGFLLVFVCCFISAFTGDILGMCWTLTQERRPDLRQGTVRYPYPAIGEEAYGKFGRYKVGFYFLACRHSTKTYTNQKCLRVSMKIVRKKVKVILQV